MHVSFAYLRWSGLIIYTIIYIATSRIKKDLDAFVDWMHFCLLGMC